MRKSEPQSRVNPDRHSSAAAHVAHWRLAIRRRVPGETPENGLRGSLYFSRHRADCGVQDFGVVR